MKALSNFIKKYPGILIVIIITLLAAFLRLYNLEKYATFLADQGRDAIIIKRIATFEHFTAIGPPTSIGYVFLGPFYYYFIAPWFWLFRFQPVGLVFGVAFFSICFIPINYLVIKKIFDKKTALISTFLIAFSSTMIDFSRFSWNPNLLPLFALITYILLVLGFEKKSYIYFALFGIMLSFSMQLHYLALILIPPSGILFIANILNSKKNAKKYIIGMFVSIATFILGTSPLIIFDLKHNFLNVKSFINLISTPNAISSNSLANLFGAFNFLNQYTLNQSIPQIITTIIGVILFIYFLTLFRSVKLLVDKKSALFVFLILTIIGVSMYPGPKHAHYFGIVYPFYFAVIALLLSRLFSSLFGKLFLISLLSFYVYLQTPGYRFFYADQLNQIEHSKKVVAFLDQKIGSAQFNFAVQPDGWQENAYLYFLELNGKRPVNKELREVTDQMFVICGNPCDPYTTRSWNVTMFGSFKIADEWNVEGLKIYKLVH